MFTKPLSEILIYVDDWCQHAAEYINTLRYKLNGFQLIESKASRNHKLGGSSGGIIVGIGNTIKDLLVNYEIEKHWIIITIKLNRILTCILFVYLPPNENYMTNRNILKECLEVKISEGYEVVLAGDLLVCK
ncbi:hypothetical protein LAZ67_X001122 [Cordylochernes scorpioides]|uniref:Uncharacterized protein n=1 Tax=Cordylochernes scorpioides TaxID=51811 RepID=A0ABY6LSL9_9ARAC|nr:hypothetical protein LAZ67_X001122 [Cordylochernes scorpioides]